jgi:hypothetical protein
MEETYYQRNKERIKAYYAEHREELKAKALARYYRKKAETQDGCEPPRKKQKTYEFKIEWIGNKSQDTTNQWSTES